MISPSHAPARIGLIGVSGYAQIYLDLLAEDNRTRAELVAAVVIPQDQDLPVVKDLRDEGVRIYSSYEAMIDAERGKLNLCLIPTGIQWHARMTIAALQAGAHVLVEKPLAGSVADAEAIRECEEATQRWVAVGFQDLYTDEAVWLKKQLLDGAIGKVTSIRVIGLWPRSAVYYNRNHWAGRLYIDGAAAHDSPLNNAFAHFVNLAFYLAGTQPDTSASVEILEAELLRAHLIESFDSAVVKARTPEGVDIWVGVSHACEIYREPEIIIEGAQGRAEWRHERECVVAPQGGKEIRRPIPDSHTSRQRMLGAVFDRLEDPTARICGTDIALHHTHFIEALHQDHPIEPLAPSRIVRKRIPGHANEIPTIRGIEDLLDRAMREGRSLRELGFTASQSSIP